MLERSIVFALPLRFRRTDRSATEMTEVTKDTEYKSLMNACCAPNLRANLNSSRSRPCSTNECITVSHLRNTSYIIPRFMPNNVYNGQPVVHAFGPPRKGICLVRDRIQRRSRQSLLCQKELYGSNMQRRAKLPKVLSPKFGTGGAR